MLGYPSTRVMWRHMTRREFFDWWAYDQVEPIGAMRGDYQAASVCATIMNGFAVMARSRKRFKIKDFLLEWGKEAKVAEPGGKDNGQPWQKMKLVARMWAAASKVEQKRPTLRARQTSKADKVEAARAALKANDRRPKKG